MKFLTLIMKHACNPVTSRWDYRVRVLLGQVN